MSANPSEPAGLDAGEPETPDTRAAAVTRRFWAENPPIPWSYRASRPIAAILSVALVVLAGTLILNNGSLRFETTTKPGNPIIVPIDEINRVISYRGPWTGYEGPPINDSCLYCPIGAQEGAAIRLPIATWYLPQNVSIWIYTNVSGSFPVQAPGCSPEPCVYAWEKVFSYETYVQKGAVLALTLFATFKLPDQSGGPPLTFIDLNPALGNVCMSWNRESLTS